LPRRNSIGTPQYRPCIKIENPNERNPPNILKRLQLPTIRDKGGISTTKRESRFCGHSEHVAKTLTPKLKKLAMRMKQLIRSPTPPV